MPLAQHQILYRLIDEIIWNDWDPVGINDCPEARDEYQGYTPKIFRLKLQNADKETIAQLLLKVEIDRMGLFGNIENCRKVAEKIVNA